MKKTTFVISLALSVINCFAKTHNISSVENLRSVIPSLSANDIILLEPNTYLLTEPLVFPVSVTIAGNTDDRTKVVFDGNNQTRGIIFRESSTIKNITIQNFYREMTSDDLIAGNAPTVASVSKTDYPGAGVLFAYSKSAVVSNCVFKACENKNGWGGALALCGEANVYDSLFEENLAKHGGGVYIGRDSGITTAYFYNTTFKDNTANNNGGGVVAHKNATIVTVGCTLKENSAKYGGFFCGTQAGDSGSSMYATNSVFLSNSATQAGGAVSFWRGGVQIFYNCGFTNNTAVAAGGAIEKGSQGGCKANIRELSLCSFATNSAGKGGAIYMSNPTNHIESLVKCIFDSNSATSSSANNDAPGGGAILSAVKLMDSCIFTRNTATRHGGAWQILGDPEFTFDSMCVTNTTFSSNGVMRASHVVYMGGGAVAFGYKFNETFAPVKNVNFYDCRFNFNFVTNGDNKADTCYGGAVFSPAGSGFERCSFSNNFCCGMSTLYSNAAHEKGIKDTLFYGNTNYCGGALMIEWCDTNKWNHIEGCTFEENVSLSTADAHGGAALVHEQGHLALTSCVFKNNFSHQNGGALYIGSTYTAHKANANPYKNKSLPQFAVKIALDKCRFKGNSTLLHGGAIVLSKTCDIPSPSGSIRNCLFDENIAGINNNETSYSAGAIYITQNTAISIENCTFAKNKVVSSYTNGNKYTKGGAIALGSEMTGITNCLFVGNSAATNSYKASSIGSIYPWKFENIYSESETAYANIAYSIEAKHPDFPEHDRTRFDPTSPIFDVKTNPAGLCLINGINGNIVGAEMKFADYENGNYTLVSKSAAIDKGHSLPWMANSADFTGDANKSPRIYGTSVDIGCYEYIPKFTFTTIMIR